MEIEHFQNTGSSVNSITSRDESIHVKSHLNYGFNSADTLIKEENDLPITTKTSNDVNSLNELYCQVKLDSILQLKESTKQLLCLLEDIQTKVHTNVTTSDEHSTRFSNIIKTNIPYHETKIDAIELPSRALKNLKTHAQALDAIYIENEDDDCSIYKRLTRKCHCLNNPAYNDILIHFNEEPKYNTSSIGEIIKNMRILRKFLYMGGNNTKNALTFLNEGLTDSHYTEKVDIALGCAHADLCNIFDEHSIVIFCVSWPCTYQHCGNYTTQTLAAGFLYKLAGIVDGRKYLNYTSKIANDIRKVLRKKSSYLEMDIIESLNNTLNILKPSFTKDFTVTHFSKSVYEGIGTRTVRDLMQHQQHMNLDEIFTHLHLLNNYSSFECGKEELKHHLPNVLTIFKYLLIKYNNSELNIVVTNILNNLVATSRMKLQKSVISKSLVRADTVTKPIKMIDEICQMPPKKGIKRQPKLKPGLGVSPNKCCRPLKKKEWESSILIKNRSRKFNDLTKSIIVVPIENK